MARCVQSVSVFLLCIFVETGTSFRNNPEAHPLCSHTDKQQENTNTDIPSVTFWQGKQEEYHYSECLFVYCENFSLILLMKEVPPDSRDRRTMEERRVRQDQLNMVHSLIVIPCTWPRCFATFFSAPSNPLRQVQLNIFLIKWNHAFAHYWHESLQL